MYTIKKMPVYNAEKIRINDCLWGFDKYCPEVFAQLSYDDEGFIVKFTVAEKNPKRLMTKNFDPVHLDSCVEFFANFMPDSSNMFFNFETNANGVMNVASRTDRHDGVLLSEEEVAAFKITPALFEDHWEISYKIGFDFIKNHYPDFDFATCDKISANFYKCGDETEIEHYICWNHIGNSNPDFHQPEFFAEIKIEK